MRSMREPINAKNAKRIADLTNTERLDRDLEDVYYWIRKEAEKGNMFFGYYPDKKLSAEHIDRLRELGYDVTEYPSHHNDDWIRISFENPDGNSESATSDWEF